MEFEKYQHVERFGTPQTNGIENGLCYVFPKIDGTNASLWFDKELKAGSRNRELSKENDNANFYEWASKQNCFVDFFKENPTLRLFGEWLVPHTLKTYEKKAWNRFYVFDVLDGESYLEYETYQPLLEKFGIEYIPPICKIQSPSYEKLVNQLEKNEFLIENGKGIGEGIVIKNYKFVNKFGRVCWAKIINNEFKATKNKVSIQEIKDIDLIEQKIVEKYVTLSFVEKEYNKIVNESEWESKFIPRLLNTVYYCLLSEECYSFIKEFKNPTVDFKRLQMFCTNKIKELMPNLF